MLPDDIYILNQAPTELLQSLAVVHSAAFEQLGQQGWDEGQLSSSLHQAGGRLAYAVADDGFAGFALFNKILDEAELLTIAVNPKLQQAGVASQLIKTASDSLKKDGVTNLFLEVRCDNVGAIACYQKLGFEQLSTRENYYTDRNGAKIDARIYKLSL